MKKETRLYNVLFPIWLLLLLPSYLWLLLIPLNYLVDTGVAYYALRNAEDELPLARKKFCLKHSWKLCIVGFISDAVGSGVLLGITLLLENYAAESQLSDAMLMNPFGNIFSLLIYLLIIAGVGILIYWIDKRILSSAGLTLQRAATTAKWLGIITAPYLFLIPTEWIYS